MPGRLEPLVNEEIYHIFNRSITNLITFPSDREYRRFINTFKYYLLMDKKPRFSYFLRLPESRKNKITSLQSSQSFVEILAYCLMPNHFHFLLKQNIDLGISTYLSLISNSYTRYFNTKNRRVGPVFQGRFKAVRIESEEQLIHVSRYIHLNPYSAGIIKKPQELENYPYSSFSEYLNPGGSYKNNLIVKLFDSTDKYREFVINQSDHQRQMERIKHLTIDLEQF